MNGINNNYRNVIKLNIIHLRAYYCQNMHTKTCIFRYKYIPNAKFNENKKRQIFY